MSSYESALPPYAFVPGGPFPHPTGSPEGHMAGEHRENPQPIVGANWRDSAVYLHGFALFNAGYYWEAHEVWEGLWHAHGRRGPEADVLKGLIKLAAAGVKMRQRQRHGVVTHANRAAEAFQSARIAGGDFLLGFDMLVLMLTAFDIAVLEMPATEDLDARVVRVFDFELHPE